VVQGCVTAKAAPGERERAALRVAVAWLMAGQRTGEARALSELAQRAGVEKELARLLALAWHAADGAEATRYLALAEGAMAGQAASHEGAAVLAAKGDALAQQGKPDEAFAAYRAAQKALEEAEGLDVEVRLHQRAVVEGKIADILMARGDLDEALRIRREVQIPVFERLGDVREALVTRTNIALTLLQMPGLTQERAMEITSLLTTAYRDAVRLRIPEAAQIRALADRIGLRLPDAPP
jgi:tetratricopeptide (TPR) repeat protein